MAVVAAFMGFWNTAGYYRFQPFDADPRESWSYGWPATYLERTIRYDLGPSYTVDQVDDSLTWRLWERAVRFRSGFLGFNAAIALGICLVCGTAVEAWRRRRNHLLQIYLGELILLVLLVALGLGVGRYLVLDAAAKERGLNTITGPYRGDLEILYRQLPQRNTGTYRVAHGTPECIWSRLPGRSFKLGDRLVALHLSTTDFTAGDAATLGHTGIQVADFEHVNFRPGGLEGLSSCPHLEQLNLYSCNIPAESLRAISGFERLRILELPASSIDKELVASICEVRSLEQISIDGDGYSGDELAQFAALPSLWRLELLFNSGRRTCRLDSLSKLQQLQDLHIRYTKLTSQEIDALAQLTDLQRLDLELCEFPSDRDAARLIDDLPWLEDLAISLPDSHSESIQSISRLEHLEELYLIRETSDDDLSVLARRITLKKLKCGGKISDTGLEKLASLDGLEHLSLTISSVTDKSVATLSRMKNLRRVSFGWQNSISPEGQQRLKAARPDLEIEFSKPYF